MSFIQASVYDLETGRILRNVFGTPAVVELQRGEGQGLVEGDYDDLSHYVVDAEARDRPWMSPSYSTFRLAVTEALTVEGVPVNADVLIDGENQGVMDDTGVLELTFNFPGVYRLVFRKFPFHDMEADIEVTP